MRAVLFVLKLGLKILAAPLVLALMLFTWLCFGLLYVSSFIFGLASTVVALLGIAVLVTYSPQNGLILLVIAFLVSPLGLPMAAAWLVGKVQDLRYAIQYAAAGGVEPDLLLGVIMGVVGMNGVPEALIAAVLTAAVCKALLAVGKRSVSQA